MNCGPLSEMIRGRASRVKFLGAGGHRRVLLQCRRQPRGAVAAPCPGCLRAGWVSKGVRLPELSHQATGWGTDLLLRW
jgi:hypothetical protein